MIQRRATLLCASIISLLVVSDVSADAPRRTVETSAALGDPRVVDPEVLRQNGGASRERQWRGPRVELGFVHYSLSDSSGGGPVNGVSIGGYFATRRLRLGVLGDAGSRRYLYDENDIALRVSAIVGYQALNAAGRLTPFIALRGDWGVPIQQRFNTTLSDGLYGIGIEGGIEVNAIRTLHMGIALGIAHMASHDLSFVSWSLRIFFGL